MITNFKIFEGVENNKPKFEQGDYVVRIYDKKQDVCSITKSMRVYDGGYAVLNKYIYEMINEITGDIISLMKEYFLKLATDEQIENMNRLKIEKKYNL